MCSSLFALMPKEKRPLNSKLALANLSRCDLQLKDSSCLPARCDETGTIPAAAAVIVATSSEEDEEVRSGSCLSAASTAFRGVGGSGGGIGGELLCDRLRSFTQELKGKFVRRKNIRRSKQQTNSIENRREDDDSDEEEEEEEEDKERDEDEEGFNGIRLRSGEFEGRCFGNHKRNDLNNNSRSNSRTRNLSEEEPNVIRNGDVSLSNLTTEPAESRSPFVHRALPPLPPLEQQQQEGQGGTNVGLLGSASSIALGRQLNDSDQSEEDGQVANQQSRISFTRNRRHLSADFGQRRLNSFGVLNLPSNSRFGYLPPPHVHPRRFLHELNFNDESESGEETFPVQTNLYRNRSETAAVTHPQVSTNSQPTNLINLNNNLIRESSTPKSWQETRASEISRAWTAEAPLSTANDEEMRRKMLDYAASIEKVKDCGWYWGPISGDKAEKLLANEPEGSFIVRDSSDEHYIFSLTFKLNGSVRHVRIEHDQGKNESKNKFNVL